MFAQIVIAFTGVIAIYLSQSQSKDHRKWSSVFGLFGQPFWFYSAFQASQWGIFVVCILYTAAWAKGFYNHWLFDKSKSKEFL